jgi:hypothetical protein
MKLIILLDLNYTLVENSETKLRPFTKQIDQEIYRWELIELVRPHYTILITARPSKYREETLLHILSKTSWKPNDAYFNLYNLPPHLFKKKMFVEVIRPLYPDTTFVAIESNPKTIAEYKKLGVQCLTVQ